MAESRSPLGRWLLNRWTLLLVVVVAAVGVAYAVNNRPAEGEADDAAARPARAMPVHAVPTQAMTLEDTVRGVGTLRAVQRVEIRPEIAGRIVALRFDEGMAVEEGQVLVELDEQKLRRQQSAREAALRSAQVRVANAERTFARQEQLRERGVVSQDEYDNALAEVQSARAEVERLEAELALVGEQLEDTRIRAPFAGMISQRRVDRGAYVGVGDTIATLYQVDPLEMVFSVPERYMDQLGRGQRVLVTVAAFPGETFEGEVDFVSPAIEEATRDMVVKATIANRDHRLRPGGFATALATVGTRADRPVVPEEAIVATRRGYMVFVVEEGIAQTREVRTGLRHAGMVEIVEGLELNESVVRAGHMRLSGGETVRVVDEPTGEPADDASDLASPAERTGSTARQNDMH